MAVIAPLLTLVGLVGLVVGLIKPPLAIRWGPMEKKTRLRVLMIYGSLLIVSPFLVPGFGTGFKEGVREGYSGKPATTSAPTPPATPQASPPTAATADPVSASIRDYCRGIVGDSFVLMEQCIKMEQQARHRLGE